MTSRVSFSFPEISLIESYRFMEKISPKDLYYQRNELLEIRRNIKDDIRRLKAANNGECEMFDSCPISNICGRGLEFSVSQHRQMKSRIAIHGVLKAQKKIRKKDFSFIKKKDVYGNLDASILISKASRNFSRCARKRAVIIGQKDALAVGIASIRPENKCTHDNIQPYQFSRSKAGVVPLSPTELCSITKPMKPLARRVSVDHDPDYKYAKDSSFQPNFSAISMPKRIVREVSAEDDEHSSSAASKPTSITKNDRESTIQRTVLEDRVCPLSPKILCTITKSPPILRKISTESEQSLSRVRDEDRIDVHYIPA